MNNFIKRHDFFATPVWQFQYPDFTAKQGQLIEHMVKDQFYLSNYEKNGVQTTEGNLHSAPEHLLLVPLRDFMVSCVKDVMGKMGYEEDMGITAMWATRQRQGGFHHEHIHSNTFLAAVFYLFDADNNANGTVFMSNLTQLMQIQPRLKSGRQSYFNPIEQIPFVSGTCVVFPGWVKHGTFPSPSRYRIMIGMNTMPVGQANGDHYNQYTFSNPEDNGFLTLEEHRKIGYGDR